jgi:hypothetical protein
MQADFAAELGREDPALELPWSSGDGSHRYYDLKHNPELVLQIPEATRLTELSAFLTRVNAAAFPMQSAKCDAWFTEEITAEEEIFGAPGKFVSYVDLVFVGDQRRSLEEHEDLARSLCALLHRAPEMAASVELVIRRCYFHPDGKPDESVDGFCITAYISGFGEDEAEARKRWVIALALLQNALVQKVR